MKKTRSHHYEIGFHTQWEGGLRVNGACSGRIGTASNFFLGQNSFTEIHNGPNARIKGAEIEINWRASPQFTMAASAAYTDAKTRRNLCLVDDPTFTCAPPFNAISSPAGTRLPVTPRFKMAATARYEFPLAGGTAHGQASMAHQSSASPDLRRLIIQSNGNPIDPSVATGRLAAYTTADFAFGVNGKGSRELFMKNASTSARN